MNKEKIAVVLSLAAGTFLWNTADASSMPPAGALLRGLGTESSVPAAPLKGQLEKEAAQAVQEASVLQKPKDVEETSVVKPSETSRRTTVKGVEKKGGESQKLSQKKAVTEEDAAGLAAGTGVIPRMRLVYAYPEGTDQAGWPWRFVQPAAEKGNLHLNGFDPLYTFATAAGRPGKEPAFQAPYYNLPYLFAQNYQNDFISPSRPLRVEADYLAYGSQSGDMLAKGRVDIHHLTDRYETERVEGNTKTRQYLIPGEVKWTSPVMDMTASSAAYDGAEETGTYEEPQGYYGVYYMKADRGVFHRLENKAVLTNAYITTKSAVAKVPDYRLEAESVDIYPNDHYTAHHASLYFKNVRLLSVSSFSGSLQHDDNNVNMWSLIPRPSFDSDNGFGLKNSITVPLFGRDDTYFYSRLGWYTKEGFKPDVGVQWNAAPGTFRFGYAKEESSLNEDHVWVEKKPELSFRSKPVLLGKTGLYTGVEASMGRWYEGRVKGSHMLWDVYLSGPSITAGPTTRFWWRAGYRKDYYGWNDQIRRNGYYALGMNNHFTPWLNTWVSYTNNDLKGYTPYSFDTYDTEKPLDYGFRLRLSRLDSIGVSFTLRTTDGSLQHRDFTYYRDMHSFYGWITYRDIDKETQVYIQPKDFRF